MFLLITRAAQFSSVSTQILISVIVYEAGRIINSDSSVSFRVFNRHKLVSKSQRTQVRSVRYLVHVVCIQNCTADIWKAKTNEVSGNNPETALLT